MEAAVTVILKPSAPLTSMRAKFQSKVKHIASALAG
jgi:hypothetical protein